MIEYSTFELANGLRVIHNYDASTPMVAVNVLYDVGSRDESPELTGMAHLFEHLMFGGSVNVPDYDGAIERAGGFNNAWTSTDFTCFFDVAPACNVETLFWAESDRMLSLAFSEQSLEVQRNVVIEEFKQVCLNKPYGDLSHRLRELLYTVHPYRHPTIGKEIAHIERVTMDDVRRIFYSHYAPNNAVLAVSGSVALERVRELAERWFGSIERRTIAARQYPAEPAIESPRRLEISGNVPQAMIVKAFPMPGYGEDGYLACDMITDILSAGRSSRFYRRFTMGSDLFSEADASIVGSEEPGFIMVTARLTSARPDAVARAEAELEAELTQLRDVTVSHEELQRTINRYDSSFTFGTMSYVAKSQQLALALVHGEDINDTVPRYRAVTAADVQRAAKRYLDPRHSATIIYTPNNP